MKSIIFFLIIINSVLNSQPYIYNIVGREDSSDVITINSIDYFRIKENYIQKTNASTLVTQYLFDNGDIINDYFLSSDDTILIAQKFNNLVFYDTKNEMILLNIPVFSDCINDILIKNNTAYVFACSNYSDDYIDLYSLNLVNGQYNLLLSYPYSYYFHGVSTSSNLDYLYFEYEDTTYIPRQDDKLRYIVFSTLSNSIVSTGLIANLGHPNMDGYILHKGNNNRCIIESINIGTINERYFRLFDFNNSTGSSFIYYQGNAKPYSLSENKYLILADFVDSVGNKLNTGVFQIYDINSLELLKTINLPARGDINVFESFPNNLYYIKDIELSTRHIYTLKMDSLLNVLNLTSLSPSSKIVNSAPFTLTVNGHGFDTLSTVYFNDSAKTTTYVNDSVLTASISTSDISVVGNYPVWVADEWGTSDTLMFAVTPQPADLSSLSPAIALTYDPLYDLEYFTITVSGSNFDSSSVIYFGGYARTTTFVSSTVLTFQGMSYDVGVNAHTIPLWVSNGGAISDTLLFSVQTNNALIEPVFSCIVENGREEFTAHLGYINSNSAAVFIPIGSKNQFWPSPQDRGQPKIFLPGSNLESFTIDFDGSEISWQFATSEATFSGKSDQCE